VISMKLKRYSTVKRWLSHVFADGVRSESTEKTYLHFLQRYSKFAGMTPDELIEERRRHLKSPDEYVKRQHEELLTEWRNYLEEKRGLARSSVVTALNVIKSFYRASYVPLEVKSPKSWPVTRRKVPTREELAKIIETCRRYRDKALIMFLAQSGISLRDLRLVKYSTIREEFEGGVEPIHIPIERSKTKTRYDTFIGSNTIEFLKGYFKESEPSLNRPIFNTARRTIQYVVKTASIKAGLKPHTSPHKLRAFFNTYMSLSFHESHSEHIPLVEYWMGHKLPYMGVYMVPPVEIQRGIYKAHEYAVSLP